MIKRLIKIDKIKEYKKTNLNWLVKKLTYFLVAMKWT